MQGTGTLSVPAVAEVWEIRFADDQGGTTVAFDGTTVTAGTPAWRPTSPPPSSRPATPRTTPSRSTGRTPPPSSTPL
ncbi:MAG: hypothetical protein MZW92_07115 [Comamonadaceae bacterium]|nr:hypothetical protein [Comamonadaceae bacterium]